MDHQFSYTVPLARVGDDPDFQSGVGDILLNYRYQLIKNADMALAPRFSRRWCNKMSSIPAAPDFLTV